MTLNAGIPVRIVPFLSREDPAYVVNLGKGAELFVRSHWHLKWFLAKANRTRIPRRLKKCIKKEIEVS